jgi:hypothetical protein
MKLRENEIAKVSRCAGPVEAFADWLRSAVAV